MNTEEAQDILSLEVVAIRSKSYEELAALIGSPLNFERKGPSGAAYQIEIQAFWDNPRSPDGNLRVFASIDDGKFLSAFKPSSVDFIKSPDGNFVGE
ncbi:MAG: hypothetical protein JRF62_17635 [Deltaproteobacteria bacterium]|nr:hypothetical protein [Deltaproteobacteria bacterium]